MSGESQFVTLVNTMQPQPRGMASIARRRVVVRLEPRVVVDDVPVGVVQFGSDTKWLRRSFDQFVIPSDSTTAAFIHIENLPSLVCYCTKSAVKVTVARDFWRVGKSFC